MNLERTILENLKRCHPRLMTTTTLWSEVLMDQPQAGYSAYKSALRELEIKDQVVTVTGEDRDKAKITDAGLARMAES